MLTVRPVTAFLRAPLQNLIRSCVRSVSWLKSRPPVLTVAALSKTSCRLRSWMLVSVEMRLSESSSVILLCQKLHSVRGCSRCSPLDSCGSATEPQPTTSNCATHRKFPQRAGSSLSDCVSSLTNLITFRRLQMARLSRNLRMMLSESSSHLSCRFSQTRPEWHPSERRCSSAGGGSAGPSCCDLMRRRSASCRGNLTVSN